MPETILEGKVPVKSWTGDIEESAVKQLENLSQLPFAFHHIAVMPDCHAGYGMPIGGVLAAKDVIIPNAVGVDIGCGMVAVKTSLKKINEKQLHDIIKRIRNEIPTGFKKHKQPQDVSLLPQPSRDLLIVNQEFENARHQVGTLGGGNHFIEIQKGSDGHIWYMIHSGSRNLGHTVAKHYNRVAKELNKTIDPKIPDNFQLDFLPINSPEGQMYMKEMQYCTDFAFANRKYMSDKVQNIFKRFTDVEFLPVINIAHNYAAKETHYGESVIVHRKGATSAKKGETGIIPGSQGVESYIVRGKGNPESFMSCSHGAGRKLSRTAAKKSLDLEKEIEYMNSKKIVHNISSKKHLDEAPSAYKDIAEVMKNQSDLTEILVELKPLAVVKG